MFRNKFFMLAAWYLIGSLVSYIYGGKAKNPKKINSEQDVEAMVDSFFATQKKLFQDIEKHFNLSQTPQKLSEKRDELMSGVGSLVEKGKEVFEEIKSDITSELAQEEEKKTPKKATAQTNNKATKKKKS